MPLFNSKQLLANSRLILSTKISDASTDKFKRLFLERVNKILDSLEKQHFSSREQLIKEFENRIRQITVGSEDQEIVQNIIKLLTTSSEQEGPSSSSSSFTPSAESSFSEIKEDLAKLKSWLSCSNLKSDQVVEKQVHGLEEKLKQPPLNTEELTILTGNYSELLMLIAQRLEKANDEIFREFEEKYEEVQGELKRIFPRKTESQIAVKIRDILKEDKTLVSNFLKCHSFFVNLKINKNFKFGSEITLDKLVEMQSKLTKNKQEFRGNITQLDEFLALLARYKFFLEKRKQDRTPLSSNESSNVKKNSPTTLKPVEQQTIEAVTSKKTDAASSGRTSKPTRQMMTSSTSTSASKKPEVTSNIKTPEPVGQSITSLPSQKPDTVSNPQISTQDVQAVNPPSEKSMTVPAPAPTSQTPELKEVKAVVPAGHDSGEIKLAPISQVTKEVESVPVSAPILTNKTSEEAVQSASSSISSDVAETPPSVSHSDDSKSTDRCDEDQYNDVCCANGAGVAKDEVEAVRLYRLAAAKQVNSCTQCFLGECYEKGTGVDKNEGEAVRLYRLAADQGHARAQFNLATCYAKGIGVTKNKVEAAKYYRLAAVQGHTGARSEINRSCGGILKKHKPVPSSASSSNPVGHFANQPAFFVGAPKSSNIVRSSFISLVSDSDRDGIIQQTPFPDRPPAWESAPREESVVQHNPPYDGISSQISKSTPPS